MKWILIVLAVLIVGLGGYIYMGKLSQDTRIAGMKQTCVERYNAMPQGKDMVSDIDAFCGCQADGARVSSKEEVKGKWSACNDKFLKPGLIKLCMKANSEINPNNVQGSGVNCECFYDTLMDSLAQEESEPLPERRNQLSTQAFMACRQ